MNLTDIISIEKWEAFEKELYDRSGMNACVYDNQGNRITSYVSWANEVCPTIKSYPEGIAAICAVANQYFTKETAETKQPLVDECDAGFAKFAVPIFYKHEFLGTVGGCGHILTDGEVGTFYIEKAIGENDLGLEKKIDTVKQISENEINKLVDFVQTYLKKILSE
ncbi:MAG: PocR ligand-binding domain-containing protein [Desulfobacula sp.]|uniref:PocR ligand-binding domain-containing protein n=1 Tax=Desulfobacula sp. TaxID=2593537 RepID=UPI0025BB8933|nr:PocR ligand-binding domain-containing protein [Desulfobacula sp.]MCD4720369.1 PocR ligand-binding domain-containing protein [Desulfobacula sp.]